MNVNPMDRESARERSAHSTLRVRGTRPTETVRAAIVGVFLMSRSSSPATASLDA